MTYITSKNFALRGYKNYKSNLLHETSEILFTNNKVFIKNNTLVIFLSKKVLNDAFFSP